MQWEGAAKRSEGSRAWGCKHCRGREEGIWRNRSQCWDDSEYVTASANHSAPFPANEMFPLEQSTTLAWRGETLWLLVLLRALVFFPLDDVKTLNLKRLYCWDNLHYSGDSTLSGKYCSKSPQGVFPLSPWCILYVTFMVSAMTGWISHLDEHLQRETNGPTGLHCLFNKRDKVTYHNLSDPASKKSTKSKGTNKTTREKTFHHVLFVMKDDFKK